jgi:hypothetical protein
VRDVGVANRLRFVGLKVVEVAGWQTRGSSEFWPRGSIDHHTAGSRYGNAPSLAVCIYGRAGLSGPLCNVLIGRDGTCYVIAAGRANHAGAGSWGGLAGNSSVFGIERENVGTIAEPFTTEQNEIAARAHAALIAPHGARWNLVCRHQEWAPNRKIDTHGISGTWLRHRVHELLTPAVTPQPPAPGPDYGALRRFIAGSLVPLMGALPNYDGSSPPQDGIKILDRALNIASGTSLPEDGVYDQATINAVLNFQTFWNVTHDVDITDFPGAAHGGTRMMLAACLTNIRDGR